MTPEELELNKTHGNEYTNEDMYEQCLTCEKVKLTEQNNSGIIFDVGCKEGHLPTLQFHSFPKGDTFVIEEGYCEYRVAKK
jgi:hypothetical protein